jgi:hypothetical protein
MRTTGNHSLVFLNSLNIFKLYLSVLKLMNITLYSSVKDWNRRIYESSDLILTGLIHLLIKDYNRRIYEPYAPFLPSPQACRYFHLPTTSVLVFPNHLAVMASARVAAVPPPPHPHGHAPLAHCAAVACLATQLACAVVREDKFFVYIFLVKYILCRRMNRCFHVKRYHHCAWALGAYRYSYCWCWTRATKTNYGTVHCL